MPSVNNNADDKIFEAITAYSASATENTPYETRATFITDIVFSDFFKRNGFTVPPLSDPIAKEIYPVSVYNSLYSVILSYISTSPDAFRDVDTTSALLDATFKLLESHLLPSARTAHVHFLPFLPRDSISFAQKLAFIFGTTTLKNAGHLFAERVYTDVIQRLLKDKTPNETTKNLLTSYRKNLAVQINKLEAFIPALGSKDATVFIDSLSKRACDFFEKRKHVVRNPLSKAEKLEINWIKKDSPLSSEEILKRELAIVIIQQLGQSLLVSGVLQKQLALYLYIPSKEYAQNLLTQAAKENAIVLMEFILRDAKISPAENDHDALKTAMDAGKTEAVRFLYTHPAYKDRITPLAYAFSNGTESVITLLLEEYLKTKKGLETPNSTLIQLIGYMAEQVDTEKLQSLLARCTWTEVFLEELSKDIEKLYQNSHFSQAFLKAAREGNIAFIKSAPSSSLNSTIATAIGEVVLRGEKAEVQDLFAHYKWTTADIDKLYTHAGFCNLVNEALAAGKTEIISDLLPLDEFVALEKILCSAVRYGHTQLIEEMGARYQWDAEKMQKLSQNHDVQEALAHVATQDSSHPLLTLLPKQPVEEVSPPPPSSPSFKQSDSLVALLEALGNVKQELEKSCNSNTDLVRNMGAVDDVVQRRREKTQEKAMLH